MTIEKTLCGDCRWFNLGFAVNAAFEAPAGFGECRKYAPRGPWVFCTFAVGGDMPSSSVQSAFALVSDQDWCGEFSLKDQPND